MPEEYVDDHFDEIIGHESEIESRLIKADCTIDDLKQSNRWFIDAFNYAGEKVFLIEDDFDKAMVRISEQITNTGLESEADDDFDEDIHDPCLRFQK